MPLIEIYRAKIDPADVERLLEIRADAVAEFQQEVPELLRAELVRLEDDTWLDIVLWSEPVGDERVEQACTVAPKSAEMHSIITNVLGHDRGELVHSSDSAWATTAR